MNSLPDGSDSSPNISNKPFSSISNRIQKGKLHGEWVYPLPLPSIPTECSILCQGKKCTSGTTFSECGRNCSKYCSFDERHSLDIATTAKYIVVDTLDFSLFSSRKMGKDYYKILEIPRNASSADIKKAYKKMALKVC